MKSNMKYQFKPEKKFINFLNRHRGKLFFSKKAYLDGKYISDYFSGEQLFFIILDDNSVSIEVDDNSKLTEASLKDFIDTILIKGKKIKINDTYVINIPFEKDDIKLYLEIEKEQPLKRLQNLIQEESDKKDKKIDITDQTRNKIYQFFNKQTTTSTTTDDKQLQLTDYDRDIEDVSKIKRNSVDMINDMFGDMENNKKLQLDEEKEKIEKEIEKYYIDRDSINKKLKKSLEDLKAIKKRINNLNKNKLPYNGYLFSVSELKTRYGTHASETEKNIVYKIADFLKIDGEELFDELFNTYFEIKIVDEENKQEKLDDKKLKEYLLKADKFGRFLFREHYYEYKGNLKWNELVDSLISAGFKNDQSI